MKKIIMILIMLLIAGDCFGQKIPKYKLSSFSEDEINHYQGIKPKSDPWNIQDTLLELGFLTIAGLDLWQTCTFLYKDKNLEEKLSWLGHKPSKKKLFLMSGAYALSHIGVAIILPKRYLRTIWQISFIGIHTNSCIQNYKMGVKVSF